MSCQSVSIQMLRSRATSLRIAVNDQDHAPALVKRVADVPYHVQQVSQEDKAQLAALETAIAVEDKAIAKLQRDMEGLNAEAEAIAAALEGVGGAQLKEQRALVEALQQVVAFPPCSVAVSSAV